MKQIFLLLTTLLIYSNFGYSQAGCSANPGGDQNICLGDDMILYGEDSPLYLDPLDAQWTADASNPMPVTFDDATALETKVYPDGSPDFVAGNYKFELCVICSDHTEACQSVNIYVGEIVNPAVITESDMTVCGNTVTINGSQPDPGVTTTWFVEDFNGDFIENGNMLTLDHSQLAPCSYEVIYKQSIGSCTSSDTIEITFITNYNSVSASVDIPSSCPACTKRIRLSGTPVRCGGLAQWTIISYPAGVDPNDIIIENPNNTFTWVEVPENGEYTFGYEIDNGDCISGSATVTCTINEIPGFGLGPDERFGICSNEWNIPSLYYEEPPFPGASYQWSISSSTISNHGITFSDPNSNATTLNFTNIPLNVAPEGWRFTIKLTMTLGDCEDEKLFKFTVIPELSIEQDIVNLLCGGNQAYHLISNINNTVSASVIRGKVVSSPSLPIGFDFNVNSPIDLTEPGMHCFDITFELSLNDPITSDQTSCISTEYFCVQVADIPSIDCGSPIVTCVLNTQLNGNTPLDENGDPLNIPVYWEQTGGPPATLSDPNTEDPFVSDLEHGNTYTFKYTISDEPDCMIFCENTITVRPEEACEPCEITAQVGECVNGCTTVNLSGADNYEWSPSDGVDDSDPDNPLICNAENTMYLVTGFVDGEACGSLILDVPGCESNDIPCDFILEKVCTHCGCGNPVGGASLRDSDGNYINVPESGINLEWIVDGQIVSEGHNNYAPHYTDPYVLCAHVSFTQADGTVCDTTMCVDVTCHGDCPEVTFATCADAPFSSYPECANYVPENACYPGGYSGYVWALDQAGHPISKYDWNIDFPGFGGDNPMYINTWGIASCNSIPFAIDHPNGCDTLINFGVDCCSQIQPDIDCGALDGDCWMVNFPEICGTETYVFEVTCFTDFETTTHEVDASTVQNTGSFCVPIPKDCDLFAVHMFAVCSSSGEKGPSSNCVIIDTRYGDCTDFSDPCDLGGGKNRSLAIDEPGPDQSLVYPNPNSNGIFYYQHNFPLVRADQSLFLNILDVNGKLIYTSVLANHHGAQKITTTLPTGLYMLNVKDEKGITLDSKKLIITGK